MRPELNFSAWTRQTNHLCSGARPLTGSKNYRNVPIANGALNPVDFLPSKRLIHNVRIYLQKTLLYELETSLSGVP